MSHRGTSWQSVDTIETLLMAMNEIADLLQTIYEFVDG